MDETQKKNMGTNGGGLTIEALMIPVQESKCHGS